MQAAENQSKIISNSDAWILSSAEFQELAGKLLKQGLVAHYSFNGNAQDTSGHGLHGTVYGATLTTDRFGNSNSAYQFDGVDDYIEVPHNDLLNLTDNFTISLWIKQPEANISRGYRLVDKTTAGVNDGYNLDTSDGSTGRKLRLTGGQQNVSANSVYSLNEWHHVIVVFSKGVSTFYLGGRIDGSGKHNSDAIKTNSLTLRIGTAHGSNTEFFKGVIDDIRIYNRALSETDIKELYDFPAALRQCVLAFDGQDDYVNLGKKPEFKIEKNITIEAWIYASAQKVWAGILSNIFDTGLTESGYGLLLDGKSGIYFGLEPNSQSGQHISYLSSGANTVNLNQWHHVAGTYNGQEIKIYVDGVEKAKQSLPPGSIKYNPENDLLIGMYKDNNESYAFNGKIAEVRLWNYVRSPEQLQQYKNSRLVGNETGLVGYWPLNDDAGTTVADQTGHGNNGTINGATWQQQLIPIKSAQFEGKQATNIEAEEDTATAAGDVAITQILYKGTVKGSQADEYIEITNKGTAPTDLSGWRVTSAGSRNQIFTFPQGTLLQPGKNLRVYSNQVPPEFGGFSFGSKTAIWKDSGDEGKLFDAQGNNVSTWAYGISSIAGIKAELGVPQLVVEASPSAINRQTALGGKVTFTEALKLAIRSFLEDDNDVESPLGLILNDPGSYDLPNDIDKAEAIKVLRSYLNRPNSKIILHSAKVGHRPENAETIEDNWIFELLPKDFSSNIHWAIIDRSGVKAAYNYGFG